MLARMLSINDIRLREKELTNDRKVKSKLFVLFLFMFYSIEEK